MKIIALLLLVQTVLRSCASPANLDIGSANHPDFFLETGRECTLTRSIYRPKRGREWVTVSHGGGVLWSTGEKDKCVNVQVFYRDKLPLFLRIVFAKDNVIEDVYYVYKKKWEMCKENVFKEALEREGMQILKIDSPNPLLGTLQRNGSLVTEETFVSSDKCTIGRVEYNGKTLWEGERGDSLLSYTLISEDEKAILLHLVYTSDESFYELSNGTWKKITRGKFLDRDGKLSPHKSAIDLNNLENNAYKVSKNQILRFSGFDFIPKIDIHYVIDGNTVVERIPRGTKLEKVTVYMADIQKYMDVKYMRDKKEYHHYFVKVGEEWRKATREDYYLVMRTETPVLPQISLDIRIPDEKICKIENTGDPVCERVIIPKNEYRVTKVVDRNKLIWEAGEFEYILKATTYLDIGKPVLLSLKYANVEKYFGLSNGSWSTLRKRNFDKQAKKLKGRRIIDVNKKEGTFYSCSEYVHCGIPTVSFTPKEKVMVIKDGDQIIYTSLGGIENPTIRLYVAKEFKLLALSYIQHKTVGNNTTLNLHFETVHGVWKPANEKRFKELLKPPQSSESELKKIQRSNISLDLSKVNPTYFTIEWDGSLLTITPKEGCNVTKITEKDDGIWEAVGNENTVIVWIRYKNKKPSLMHILVENSPKANKHFEKKQDGKWLPITEEDYDKVLGK
ncbi:signal peptide containing protein [Theileria equi strain WA]|uniref:Signal peptide containing protein n=1 Tax=Theileria equi strain WA TaxID=1537102 RepID=L1LG51_THEEQ|nr:signal peptide containing protein [Theileria equi strain WA]EKX74133.1 signal peptide containing protein [Theileria equi strain WA]|eukprot:XP_004833585.1 signal peptide containing protein [Theileria equi strain WA]